MKVYALETNNFTRRILEQFITHNDLNDVVTVLKKEPEELTPEDVHGHKVIQIRTLNLFCVLVLVYELQSAVLPNHMRKR